MGNRVCQLSRFGCAQYRLCGRADFIPLVQGEAGQDAVRAGDAQSCPDDQQLGGDAGARPEGQELDRAVAVPAQTG
jgi:hypothetical protein